VTISLHALGVAAVVLDIEGTTTPVSFVHDVLFPYARAHLRAHIDAHRNTPELAEVVGLLREEWIRERPDELAPGVRSAPDESVDALAAYLGWLMDHDRKSQGLKLLQGLIWRAGYEDGTLRGEVYPDVRRALERWGGAGIEIAIYSSGSALAQRLLFGRSTAGDLTPLIAQYFDTGVGAKRERASYQRIADAMGHSPHEMLFVSDVPEELDAARAASMRVALCVRPGTEARGHPTAPSVRSFDEIAP
jgi:enolase-phosphatase E1